MNIKTKYEVGYRFWTPRSVQRYNSFKTYINGVEWSREESYFEPFVKHKIITSISIEIDRNNDVETNYYVKNVDTEGSEHYPSLYKESDITDFTEEEAKAIAKVYADKQEVYYGKR